MMPRRGGCLGIALASLFFCLRLCAQFTFPPQQYGDMAAQLTVEAAKQTSEPGLGAVTLTLTVTGPATLEVEKPRLGDAASAWKEERQNAEQTIQQQRAVWSQVIRLKQTRPGMEPIPDVSLRYRRGPEEIWAEAKWDDILRHVRDVPGPPVPATEEAIWLRRGIIASLAALIVLLVLVVWWRKRRRGPRVVPLPPEQWALRELEHLEQTLLPPRGEAETYHTQLSYVVRRYLMERFGFQALQQTTAEFLQSLQQKPDAALAHPAVDGSPLLSAEQQTLLCDFFQRCDLAKFAGFRTPPEECRQTTELARELVRQTAKNTNRH